MKFLVITKNPPTRTLLGPVPEKITYEEVEASDIDSLSHQIETFGPVPLYGEVKIVPVEQTVTLKKVANVIRTPQV